MKKLKIWQVTAGYFLFTVLLGFLAHCLDYNLWLILGPDTVLRTDGGVDRRFGEGTCLIFVTVVAGIISSILVYRMEKEEKVLRIINILMIIVITCVWIWAYNKCGYYRLAVPKDLS